MLPQHLHPPVSLSHLRLPAGIPHSPPGLPALPAQSPLGRLQGMQPFDFRKERESRSPESNRIRPSTPPKAHPVPLCLTNKTTPHAGSPPPPPPPPPPGRSPPRSASSSSELDWDDDDDDDAIYGNALNLTRKDSRNPSAIDKSRYSNHHGSMNPHGGSRLQHEVTDSLNSRKGAAGSAGSAGSSSGQLKQRGWNPLGPLGTQLINPQTGKKRVQCNVCLKTFCDKGKYPSGIPEFLNSDVFIPLIRQLVEA